MDTIPHIKDLVDLIESNIGGMKLAQVILFKNLYLLFRVNYSMFNPVLFYNFLTTSGLITSGVVVGCGEGPINYWSVEIKMPNLVRYFNRLNSTGKDMK